MSDSIFTTLIPATDENLGLVAMQRNSDGAILVGLEEDGQWMTIVETAKPADGPDMVLEAAERAMFTAKCIIF